MITAAAEVESCEKVSGGGPLGHLGSGEVWERRRSAKDCLSNPLWLSGAEPPRDTGAAAKLGSVGGPRRAASPIPIAVPSGAAARHLSRGEMSWSGGADYESNKMLYMYATRVRVRR